MEMIKNVFAFSIALLLMCTSMSCSSTKKNVEREKEKTEITEKEEGTKVEEKTKTEETKKEDSEWVWEPADENCDEPVEIIQPDGTKIKIPKKGVLKNKKSQTNTNIFERRKDSLNVKKTTYTKKKTNTIDKGVERKSFPWWVVIAISSIIVYIIWNERRK